MAIEAIYRQPGGQQDYTPAAATDGGTLLRLPNGLAAVVGADLAASEKGAVQTAGIYDCLCAAATVWSAGEEVWWDDTNNLAVVAGNANATFRLGVCVGGKSSTSDTFVSVDLNAVPGLAGKIVTVADSSALTASSTETVMGTVTIPASALKQGQVIKFLAAAVATATNSTDTFQFRVRLGGLAGTVVADTTAIDLANSDTGVMRGEIIIREDGASGTFVAASQSTLKTTTSQTVVSSTSVDTTAAITLVVTGQHSTTSGSNSSKVVALLAEVR